MHLEFIIPAAVLAGVLVPLIRYIRRTAIRK